MHARKLAVVAVTTLFAACGGGEVDGANHTTHNTSGANNTTANNTVGSNNTTANTAGTNNTVPAGPTGFALAATADFTSGTSAWHRVDLGALTADEAPLGAGDIGIAVGEQYAFALDRANDVVEVLSRDELEPVATVALAALANPHDAVDVAGKVYISMYGVGAVAVAAAPDFAPEALDLFALDTYDANPEPSAMLADDGHVVVALQRLQDFAPVDSSLLLVIDAATDTFTTVDLGMGNAQAGLRRYGASFAVGVTGNYGANDGGILAIDRAAAGSYTVGDLLVDEATLGGDLLDFVFVSQTVGYAVISLPDFSSKLVRFEVGGAATPLDAVESPGFSGLDLSPDSDWLAVGDRGTAQGVSIFALQGDDLGDRVTMSMSAPPAGFRFVGR